ncbi:sugar ABC transporter substrate-binding protein [Clostridia bacterium]|nr:sugar ABC transporter substrate-binding protein [Clostridia bacterium]
MMKRTLTLCLALALLLSCSALASAPAEYLPGYYKPPVENEGQYPIAQQGVKLTYWMPMNEGAANFISSYAENPAYQTIQKNTGVELEFIHPAAGQAKESFQLIMASGDLPDMIQVQQDSWYSGGLPALYNDGAIIDIMPYLPEYAPQYLEVINYSDVAQRQIINGDKVFGFYKITYADAMPYVRFNFNKDWLNEFGLAEPRTIDQYEAVFDAVLANKPGVTPLFLSLTSGEQLNLLAGAFDLISGLFLGEDGVSVHHSMNEPAYKDELTLLHSWYERGYLSKDFASLTGPEVEAMFDAGQLACIAASVDATFNRTQGQFTVTNFPYMRQADDSVLGNNLASWPVDENNQWTTMITSTCKNAEAAVQYLNYGYTYKGSLYFSFGIEGEAWNWGENGLPQFTDLILHNEQGMTISNVSYAIKIHFGSRYCYPDAIAHPGVASNQESLKIRTMWQDDTNEQSYLRLPPITLTPEEATQRSELMTQVNTYTNEMLLKFVTGAESLDNFDSYITTVNSLGLTDAIAITQTALDRYLAK